MKRFIIRFVDSMLAVLVAISTIVICSVFPSDAKTYKTSDIEVKKVSGKWVSCIKNTNTKVDYTGVAKNQYGWWRVYKGTVNFDAYGVYKNDYGWWYVTGGKVDFSYNGLASNEHGTWLISGGKVDFNYDGNYTHRGISYYLQGGKVKRTSRTYNKKILVLGDSLASAWMISGERKNDVAKSYPNVASKYLGTSVTNLSLAGQMYSDYEDKRSISRYRINDVTISSYDIVILAAGINDFFKSASMGYDSSTSTTCFKGALNTTFRKLEAASRGRVNQGKQPIKVLLYRVGYYFNDYTNSAGYRIQDYNTAINTIASKEFHVTTYRIVTNEVINQTTYKNLTYDKLHYNAKGVNFSAIELVEYLIGSRFVG